MNAFELDLLEHLYQRFEYYNNDFDMSSLTHYEAINKIYGYLEDIVDTVGTIDYAFQIAITRFEEKHGSYILPYLYEILDNYVNFPDRFRKDVAYVAFHNIAHHYRRNFMQKELYELVYGPYINAFYEDYPVFDDLASILYSQGMVDKYLLLNQATVRFIKDKKENHPEYFKKLKSGYQESGQDAHIKVGVVAATCDIFEKYFLLGFLGNKVYKPKNKKVYKPVEKMNQKELIEFFECDENYEVDYSLVNEENLQIAKDFCKEAEEFNPKYGKYKFWHAQLVFYGKIFHNEEIDYKTIKEIENLLSVAKSLENSKASDYYLRVGVYERFHDKVRSYAERKNDVNLIDLELEEAKTEVLRFQECPPPQKRFKPNYTTNDEYAFISYSTKDFKYVYCDLLSFKSRGISFWYDAEVIPGERWQSTIEEKIKNCTCVICYLSTNFLTSDAVLNELNLFKKYKKPIIFLDLTGKKQISKIILYIMKDNAPEVAGKISSFMLNTLTSLVDDDVDIIARDKDPKSEFHIERLENVIFKKFSNILKIINSEHLSIPNNKKDSSGKCYKPNEDFVINDTKKNIYIVLDGISRKDDEYKDNNSIAKDVTSLFGTNLHKYISDKVSLCKNYVDAKILLEESYKKANEDIAKYLATRKDEYKGREVPGCVGVVAFIINNNLYYASFGDCMGILVRGEQRIIIAQKQTTYVFDCLGVESDRKTLYEKYVNNKDCYYGYSVANGDKNASVNFDVSYMKLEKGDVIYLLSDGISDFIQYNRNEYLQNLTLAQIVEGSNKQDIIMKKPYFDDKTIIRITIGCKK